MVNQTYQAIGLPAIDGILGGDLMVKTRAVIDYGKMTIRVRFRKSGGIID